MPTDLFDFAAECLERKTSLDRLAARGTLRIAIKAAGLSPSGVRPEQLRVVIDKILPAELEKCGVEGARDVCTALASSLAGISLEADAPDAADTDEIFRRLGGS